ncbi:cytochrome P450 [Clohesyomyces aquaticus]|uniref:Cytochrome P450 n=1 Tax=Clohesyomyces aquaticus TaxID=1231657 RepID=A0A1Y1Z4M5_9PLEO|nr:cytochrome P450 [Clohesyomyces aquaticus]
MQVAVPRISTVLSQSSFFTMGLLLFLLPTVAAIFTIYCVIARIRRSAKAKSLGCQPAPLFRPWDVIGVQNFKIEINGLKTNRLSYAFLDRKKEMSAKMGRDCKTFRIYYPPGETWFYTFDPKNLQAVLATQFQDFQQPTYKVGALQALLGPGIFSANGLKWEHSRALLKPQFMREQIADLGLFETHVQDLISALPGVAKPGDWTPIFDLQPLLERFTMDIATEFLFGESVHSQKDDNTDTSALVSKNEMTQFVQAFFAAEKTTAKSIFYGDLFWLAHDRKFKGQCKVVHEFVDMYVHRRLRDDGSDKKPGVGKYVVLDAIVNDMKDPHELRSQLLNILLAGSDTISGTLGFLLASLAQHPRILKKLRDIILHDFGSFNQPKEITLSGLKNCSYLQWCLNETLRVYPTVPVNFREAVRDTTLPVGGGSDGTSKVFIPKGHFVAWELWTMHSDPELWGPDASLFIPERWEGRKFGFDYLPFNAGPRICIGQQFALAEIAYLTVRLLQKFDSVDGPDLPEGRLLCDWKMVDKVAGGVNIRLRSADSRSQ